MATLVLLIVIVCLLTVKGVIRTAGHAEKPARSFTRRAQFPEPRLEAHPVARYTASRAEAEKELHSYGWINRKAGVAHIPIERAMTLLLERGLPDGGGGRTRLQLMQSTPAAGAQPKTPVVAPTPERTVSP